MRINFVPKFRAVSNAFCCLALLGLLLPATGCGENGEDTGGGSQDDSSALVESAASAVGSNTNAPPGINGQVIETMESGGYTYILVQTPDENIWAAGPVTELVVGQKVSLAAGMLMKNFYSKTLDRTFETIYFVQSFGTRGPGASSADNRELIARAHGGRDVLAGKEDAGIGDSQQPVSGTVTVLDCEVTGDFERAADGQNVAEIYAGKTDLAGQMVKVRGIVVKFTPSIMGTNWLHLQDGTGEKGSCDLTATTASTASVGDLVTIEGILGVDKDFGAGYRYKVIIEDAKLTTE